MLVGGFGCAVSSPPVNNSDSPGSSGNSSPVSMKTMIRIPGSTADPKTPFAPNQYIGSRMAGKAVTAVLMTFQDTGERCRLKKAWENPGETRRTLVENMALLAANPNLVLGYWVGPVVRRK